jgi:hypothetical protein
MNGSLWVTCQKKKKNSSHTFHIYFLPYLQLHKSDDPNPLLCNSWINPLLCNSWIYYPPLTNSTEVPNLT